MDVLDTNQAPPDERLVDTTPYGAGKDDSITDTSESAALTQHTITIGENTVSYTARAGHLVTNDMYSAQPTAKIFYVAFTTNAARASERPITFFYNGGPGSSSVFLLLGSFGPHRIKTNMPYFTPPAPYSLEDNPDSLIDWTDLVFINPVGTGYSAAIAPGKNGDFWGVDEDARSIKQFIKRYLTAFSRWNSPKFLFGESYGTPRTCVLCWLLHEDGIDLNGIVLQSSILDASQQSNSIGLLPTLAADALYHNKVTLDPPPTDLAAFMDTVIDFARGPFIKMISDFPKHIDPTILRTLSDMVGIPSDVIKYWGMDPGIAQGPTFLLSLLQDRGFALGIYDGRVKAVDTGIAGSISPNAGGNDPTITAVGGVYTAMWNVYLNDELRFTSTSPFMDLNDEAFKYWNWGHFDPTGEQRGGSIDNLYTSGDLAASMALNPYLKVFSANGYYDAVTPFFRTILALENMPLEADSPARNNLTIKNYPSGHMIYLDPASRSAMKADLVQFYESTHSRRIEEAHVRDSRGARRVNRIPY